MTDRLELAERVEKATGPNRALDGEIGAIIGTEFHSASVVAEYANDAYAWGDPEIVPNWAGTANSLGVPKYTASLDAAMSLDPPNINPVPLWNEAVERCWQATHLLGESFPAEFARRLPAFRTAAALRASHSQSR